MDTRPPLAEPPAVGDRRRVGGVDYVVEKVEVCAFAPLVCVWLLSPTAAGVELLDA